jgi:hypothetical protein
MTLKQFLYILISAPAGFVVYKLFPTPIINIMLGLIVLGVGVGLAFLPINDRPLDVWIKNLIKRLTSATQYTFHKENSPLYFLEDLYFVTDPHKVVSHVESKEKLAAYLEKTQPRKVASVKKNQINALLKTPTSQIRPAAQPKVVTMSANGTIQSTPAVPAPAPSSSEAQAPAQPQASAAVPGTAPHHAFFTGVVKNNKKIPLPGVLVYVKNQQNVPIRLLKTNPHGIFATYNPLPDGEYQFEIKDPNGGYNFDTMNVHIPIAENRPFEFYSKELM